jgi:hypothetical protein
MRRQLSNNARRWATLEAGPLDPQDIKKDIKGGDRPVTTIRLFLIRH